MCACSTVLPSSVLMSDYANFQVSERIAIALERVASALEGITLSQPSSATVESPTDVQAKVVLDEIVHGQNGTKPFDCRNV